MYCGLIRSIDKCVPWTNQSRRLLRTTDLCVPQSIVARRGMSHGSSNNSSGPTLGSGVKKTPSRPRSAGKCLPRSGPNSSQAPVVQGKTSTPTHDDFSIMASCDASAINPELSLLSVLGEHFSHLASWNY